MSSESDEDAKSVLKVVFTQEIESSESIPEDEWSSLIRTPPEINVKKLKYEAGDYSPGSGEICLKNLNVSDSGLLAHAYFNYPCIVDPGIEAALLEPQPKVIYSDDGQEYYLDLCKEMDICPIRMFYRSLLDKKIDLKYYGINQSGFQAIAKSLRFNKIVQSLDLTENFMPIDGCFHLGETLLYNVTLSELILSGCKIGSKGAKQLFVNLHHNRSLRILDVSRNQLGDEGVSYLAWSIYKGSDVVNINLSYNNLTPKSIQSLCEAFDVNNGLTHLNLSWNNILSANAVYNLCMRLEQNPKFEELDLSWNSLGGVRVGDAIKLLLNNRNVRHLRLTNNLLGGEAVTAIANSWAKAKGLETVDLSHNPMTPKDALNLLTRLKNKRVKIRNLLLDNVIVNLNFVQLMEEILKMEIRKDTVITHGKVMPMFKSKGDDIREIVLNRAEFICKRPKKNKVDIALIVMEMHKMNNKPIGTKEFGDALKLFGANLDDDLIDEIAVAFPGPKSAKVKYISLSDMVDYVNRKWPERKLPPTPPTEQEPEILPPPLPPKGKGKGKKK